MKTTENVKIQKLNIVFWQKYLKYVRLLYSFYVHQFIHTQTCIIFHVFGFLCIIGGFQREVSVACLLVSFMDTMRWTCQGLKVTAPKTQQAKYSLSATEKEPWWRYHGGRYNRDPTEGSLKHVHVKLLTHAKQEQLLINPGHSKQSIWSSETLSLHSTHFQLNTF